MDGTTNRTSGQLRSEGQNQGQEGGEKQDAERTVFLIHTNKARGQDANPFQETIKNQDIMSESETGVVGQNDDDPVEFEGIDALPGRLEKYARQTQDAHDFGRWLAGKSGWKRYQPIGRRVATCGSHLVFHDYFRRDLVKLAEANNCCTAMLCPFCAGRRAVRHLQNTVPKIKLVLSEQTDLVPYLFTVTIRDEADLRKMYQTLRGLWSKVVKMRRETKCGNRSSCWGKFEGGVMSFEVKRGSGSGLWHVHGHAVILAPAGLDPHEFQSAWSDLCGYWAQANLKPLTSADLLKSEPQADATDKALAKDLMEVFKYALKFNAMSFDDRFQAYRELSGQRLVRAFGALWGLKFEDEFLDDCSDMDNEPYIKLVYRALCSDTGRKYTLQSTERVDTEQNESMEVCVGQDVSEWLDELDKQFDAECEQTDRELHRGTQIEDID